METKARTTITVETTIRSGIDKVWQYWNELAHITQWCQASPDWHAPKASNDLKTGGRFTMTMAARDGSMSFDFGGTYSAVTPKELIEYVADDNRNVSVRFIAQGSETRIVETFEAEEVNSLELQRGGWQAILDSFRTYTETH